MICVWERYELPTRTWGITVWYTKPISFNIITPWGLGRVIFPFGRRYK